MPYIKSFRRPPWPGWFDTIRTRSAYEGILEDFQSGKTDVLIGTQMVTKGLDFERVSVVGILNADAMLNIPDFRSFERAFQLMAQVAGAPDAAAGRDVSSCRPRVRICLSSVK